MLKIKNIKKKFGKLNVLNGIDLEFSEPGIYVILGPNGSGKTTLLKCILGMTYPDTGEITIDNNNINTNSNFREKISYLPQIAQFPENLTGAELISMIKDIRKIDSTEKKFIEIFNLEEHLNKSIKHLSGGTKQKINTVISLMFNSEIHIFDEPTVGLDPISVLKFKNILFELKKSGKIIIMTTHSIDFVEIISDSIIFLLDGEIYFNGKLDELLTLKNSNSLMEAIAGMMETSKND